MCVCVCVCTDRGGLVTAHNVIVIETQLSAATRLSQQAPELVEGSSCELGSVGGLFIILPVFVLIVQVPLGKPGSPHTCIRALRGVKNDYNSYDQWRIGART